MLSIIGNFRFHQNFDHEKTHSQQKKKKAVSIEVIFDKFRTATFNISQVFWP